MPNRLADETSPYLRQHADNPVDWWPWGAAAFEEARRRDVPVLLSVGYAACHWCHVMAHESFEDAATAAVMNELFVNVKVDREERPDVDHTYMTAVQAMTGRGGWPMTVFLAPDGSPFYGGTYFPPDDRHGTPSFRRILRSVHDAWTTRRDAVDRTAQSLRELYDRLRAPLAAGGTLDAAVLARAADGIVRAYDPEHHGFGEAPKFPQAMALDALLSHATRTGSARLRAIVHDSFLAMARGGLFDQLAGGFARYATDATWTVPHFEKMLYDNALLAHLGVRLWRATGDDEVRAATDRTLDWIARELTAPEGGAYASTDADSEGEEGKYFVWTVDEVRAVAGADADVATLAFGLRHGGNFEGRTVLTARLSPAEVARRLGQPEEAVRAAVERARGALLARRATRVAPATDDKCIASWNGLLLRACCEAAMAFGDDARREQALRLAHFLRTRLVRGDRVLRSWTRGTARGPGLLEDQAAVALGFVHAYALTADLAWLARARALAERMVRDFHDPAANAFRDVAHDDGVHEVALVAAARDLTDNAVPSGTALACELLWRLSTYDERPDWRALVDTLLGALAAELAEHPLAFGHLLGVAQGVVHGAVEVALVAGDDPAGMGALRRAVAVADVPGLVVAPALVVSDADARTPALLAGRAALDGRATAYVCRDRACELPVHDAGALAAQLAAAARAAGG